MAKLWEAIFHASRITGDDPVRSGSGTASALKQRVDLLNAKRYHALHFHSKDGGTDLKVGLADQHLWAGGGTTAGQWRLLPAEHPDRGVLHDAAQGPHRRRGARVQAAVAPGHADREHPLPLRGRAIVEATASAGEDVLNRLISTDDGARRLGEVALVPHRRRSRRRAFSSGARCSTRTRRATLRWARRIRPA